MFNFKGGIFMELVQQKKNVQIYPSRTFYYPNDIFSKRLFELTDDDYQQALEERKVLNVTEKKNHRKFGGDIVTPFRIRIDENADFTITEALDQFDFAVLCACISEWNEGNRYTTPSIIYRAISGKVGDSDANPSKDQLADILQSIDKLMRTQIGVNMTKACEYLNYNDNKPYTVVSAILPCERVTKTTINGQDATIIFFDRESPLWEISSHVKNNQILSCDTDLLDMPNRQNTRMNIAVKFYVLHRVIETIAHPKQMKSTITFADAFHKLRIEKADRKIKQRVREFMLEYIEQLQVKKIIDSFEITKSKSGNNFHSIRFTYSKKWHEISQINL